MNLKYMLRNIIVVSLRMACITMQRVNLIHVSLCTPLSNESLCIFYQIR